MKRPASARASKCQPVAKQKLAAGADKPGGAAAAVQTAEDKQAAEAATVLPSTRARQPEARNSELPNSPPPGGLGWTDEESAELPLSQTTLSLSQAVWPSEQSQESLEAELEALLAKE